MKKMYLLGLILLMGQGCIRLGQTSEPILPPLDGNPQQETPNDQQNRDVIHMPAVDKKDDVNVQVDIENANQIQAADDIPVVPATRPAVVQPTPAPKPALPAQVCTDNDQDGFFAEGGNCGPKDCDDIYSNSYPGTFEICLDGSDNDCDGKVDEEDDCKMRKICIGEGCQRTIYFE
ncbi:MAG: hypothetical protein COU35_02935 [Candidatus Magasanikbacteria bacterium CG10_big_fil_rev_8_21_14_0_10_47_10]|uniref:Uncharacterized protein n=1 Tax=Candidatus Magasanikbacteria bacterium CG10_big_fil_rev_8_21_14_0_10_47_10 TaxID=1974652 RepID=A0A2H0TQG3_9BACT|nr:MAG: hypothetical protein COU35_02935 [Candidatus Magasanikbacteria bacterium CG10_big_fil_rev_8_21_14_0_10_47_10]